MNNTPLVMTLFLLVSQIFASPCLLEDPLTQECLQSLEVSQLGTNVLPFLCTITLKRGLPNKALELCKEAAQASLDSHYNYFQALLSTMRYEEALITDYALFFNNPFQHEQRITEIIDKTQLFVKRHLEGTKEDRQGSFSHAIALFYGNNLDESRKQLEAHIKDQKQKHGDYEMFLMVRLLEKQGQLYEALEYLKGVIKQEEKVHPYLHHLHGNFLMHHLHYDKAIESFTKANSGFHELYRSGGFAFSHYNIGICYQKLNQFPQAIQPFQKSIINLESAEALNALGQVHFALYQMNHHKNDLSSAQKYYRKAIKLNPDYIVALFNMGALKLELEKYEEANELFEECLKAENRLQSCRYGLLKAKYGMRNKTDILGMLDSFEYDDETTAEVAAVMYEVGDHERAISIIGDKEYKLADVYEWKGFNQLALQQHEGMEESFKKAINLGAKKAYVYFSLGTAQLALKKYEECAVSFNNAYRMDSRESTKAKQKQCEEGAQKSQL